MKPSAPNLKTAVVILLAVAATFLLLLLTSCKPKQKIIERTDTLTQYRTITDTLRLETLRTEYRDRYDSIAPVVDSAGKVVAYDRWHYVNTSTADTRELTRLRAVADSLRSVKTKTIPVEVVKTKEVNVLKWWQKTLMAAGVVALGLLCFRIYQIIRKSGFS